MNITKKLAAEAVVVPKSAPTRTRTVAEPALIVTVTVLSEASVALADVPDCAPVKVKFETPLSFHA